MNDTADDPRSTNDMAQERNELAFMRTALAEERTLMAWVRSAVALIGFGFTIYQVFEAIQQTRGPDAVPIVGPRELGVTLTALGTLTLVFAMWQHRHARAWLRARGAKLPPSVSVLAAVFIVLVGVLALFVLLFRI